MTGSPLRRVAVVVVVYAGVAWAVLGVAGWARRVLALPELFEDLLGAGIVLGALVAAAFAWHYPELGHGDGSSDDAGDG